MQKTAALRGAVFSIARKPQGGFTVHPPPPSWARIKVTRPIFLKYPFVLTITNRRHFCWTDVPSIRSRRPLIPPTQSGRWAATGEVGTSLTTHAALVENVRSIVEPDQLIAAGGPVSTCDDHLSFWAGSTPQAGGYRLTTCAARRDTSNLSC